jgi:integrase
MRHGELCALRWKDINFEEGILQVRHTVSLITGHGYVETDPKSDKSKRKILLPSFVTDLLKQHRARYLETRLKAGSNWQEHDLVFPNVFGGFLHPNHLRSKFYKVLEEAGLPRMHIHDLRHSAATILLSMGVSIKVIQELLGHSQISITMDIYSHVLPSMQEDMRDKWDDLFRG